VLALVIVIVVGLVFGEAAVIEGLSLGASEVLVDLLASTPVVEGSTTDRTRGLSTFRVVCESAITIFGSIEQCGSVQRQCMYEEERDGDEARNVYLGALEERAGDLQDPRLGGKWPGESTQVAADGGIPASGVELLSRASPPRAHRRQHSLHPPRHPSHSSRLPPPR